MKLRYVNEQDLDRLKELYRKIPCDFPNLDEMFKIIAIVDENDRIVQAVGCIPTVEVILFIDPDWETPGMRFHALRILHEIIRKDLKNKKIVQAHAIVPPFIEKLFGKRLTKSFGWIKSEWLCYSRRVDNG